MKRFKLSALLFLFVAMSLQAQLKTITLDLSKPIHPDVFELNDKKVWTETYNEEDYLFMEFNTNASNGSTFMISHMPGGEGSSWDGAMWEGFTYSKNADTTNYGAPSSGGSWTTDQWGCMAGGGIKTDADGNILKDVNGIVLTDTAVPYLLGYWSMMDGGYDYHILTVLFDDVYNAKEVYINNHPWPYHENRDGGDRKLDQDGDYFKIIFHGLDENYEDNGKTVEYYLAQNVGGTLTQSKNWERVDLSGLGKIGGFYITMASSDSDPQWGMNTAAYFCMDKLQVEELPDVNIAITSYNAPGDYIESTRIEFKNKATGELVSVGESTVTAPNGFIREHQYAFKAPAGEYILHSYATHEDNGEGTNGSIGITVTNAKEQNIELITYPVVGNNNGWKLNDDYTISAEITDAAGVKHDAETGLAINDYDLGKGTFIAYKNGKYTVTLTPNAAHKADDYMPATISGDATEIKTNLAATMPQVHLYPYNVTVPTGATVSIHQRPNGKNYALLNYAPIDSTVSGANTTYNFRVGSGQSHYRISQPGKVTYADIFNKNTSNSPQELTITADMLEGDPKAIDHDVTSNSNYNVANVLLNINEKGHLKLAQGGSYTLQSLRSWQAANDVFSNYFIEPDYHYTVLNENGAASSDVVTVDNAGKISAVGAGTAIVLVTYDAINIAPAAGGPTFGAIWPENTGVFVVSVGQPEANITTNMTINEALNAGNSKDAGASVDAELDVFYYLADKEGYDYTFKPAGATSVSIAEPTLTTNSITYTGFKDVTANADGSYTVKLKHGRNIVKLSSGSGADYQVLTAKSVSYTVRNITNPGAPVPSTGDSMAVTFSTLYHPINKLASIYNMAAGIQYLGIEAEFSTVGGPGQYTFASKAQEYKLKIPEDFAENVYILTAGVIKVNGYGNTFGNHREIPPEGLAQDMSSQERLAYFGALPNIPIWITGVPTAPSNLVATPTETTIELTWTAAEDNVAVAGYNVYLDGELVATTEETNYTFEDLTPNTLYNIEVEAFDAEENKSDKATTSATTLAVPVSSVGLSETTRTLTYGESFKLVATVFPLNATNQNVTWKSSNISIATVDAEGLVMAVAPGNANITVTTEDGSKTATCAITVHIAVSGIELDVPRVTLEPSETYQLVPTIFPANATNKNITWSSSNNNIAQVSEKGLVTALQVGSAIITVTTADGNKTATCSLTVNETGTGADIPVISVELNNDNITLQEEENFQLTATILPRNASNQTITWTSSNNSIATVSQNGLVTAIKAGNANITVTTEDGNKTATCNIIVIEENTVIAVTSVSLNASSIEINKAQTYQLTATILPTNASNKAVTWTSSNNSIVTVSSTGLVTAIAKGDAVITVTTKDGEKAASCAITVNDPTGIEEVATNFLLAPNPVADAVTLSMDVLQAGSLEISLIDLAGTELQKLHNTTTDAGRFIRTFSVGQLAAGVYYVRIVHNGHSKLEKIIKQ